MSSESQDQHENEKPDDSEGTDQEEESSTPSGESRSSSDLNMAGDLGSPTLQSTVFTMNRMLGVSSDVDLESKREGKRKKFEEEQEEETDFSFGEKYLVSGELGEGRMGQVLEAKDIDVRRDIAIKVIKDEEEKNPEQVERFMEEAQIQGQLEHPNIPPVHELGMEEKSRVFFTMQKVEGHSLRHILDKIQEGDPEFVEEYSLTRLLQIFNKVCDGLAYAHSRGVIHRDVKPENLMVGEFGEVHLMDWGLAKVIGKDDPHRDQELVISDRTEDNLLLSMTGSVIGTPAYMAPEQARGEVEELDERSDIYSLGGILYRILSLHPPIEGQDVDTALDKVKNNAIVTPSRKAPDRDIPDELEAVAMKALSKDPEDRYQTAHALKEDITAFQEGRTLEAAEYNLWQILTKWYKRNQTLALTGTASILIIIMLVGYFIHNLRQQRQRALLAKQAAERQRKNAIQAKRDAEKARSRALEAKEEEEKAKKQALEAKEQAKKERKNAIEARNEAEEARKQAEREMRNARWNEANGLVNQGDVLSRTGRWEQAEKQFKRSVELYNEINLDSYPGKIGLWGLYWNAPRPLMTYRYPTAGSVSGTFVDQGNRILSVASTRKRSSKIFWTDPLTGKIQNQVRINGCNTDIYGAFARTKSGNQIILGCNNNHSIQIWSLKTQKRITSFSQPNSIIRDVELGPSGTYLAAATEAGNVHLWNYKKRTHKAVLKEHQETVYDLEFTPDQQLITAGHDRKVIIWDLQGKKQIRTLRGHTLPVYSVSYSSENNEIATGSREGNCIIWDRKTGNKLQTFQKDGEIYRCEFSPDGENVLIGTEDGTITMHDRETSVEIHSFNRGESEPKKISFSTERNKFLAFFREGRKAYSWQLDPQSGIRTMPGHSSAVWATELIEQDRIGVSSGANQKVKLWDLETGKELLSFDEPTNTITQITYSPDSSLLAAGEGKGLQCNIHLWNLKSGKHRHRLTGHNGNTTAIHFINQHELISTGQDGFIKVWNLDTGKKIKRIQTQSGITSAILLPDHKRLLTGHKNGRIELWNIEEEQRINQRNAHDIGVSSLTLSEGGERFLSGSENSVVKTWDLPTLDHRDTFKGHQGKITLSAFVGQDKFAITKSDQYKLWDLEKSRVLRTFKGHPIFMGGSGEQVSKLMEAEFTASLSRNGNKALTGNFENGKLRLWNIERSFQSIQLQNNVQEMLRRYRRGRMNENELLSDLIQWLTFKSGWAEAQNMLERNSSEHNGIDPIRKAHVYWKTNHFEKAKKAFQEARNKENSLYVSLCLRAINQELK